MNEASVKRIVSKALNGYENKPKVQYENDGHFIVHLIGGHWSARQDVEDALRKHIDQIQNYPEAKRIWIK